jgi:hypothetical protein
MAKRTSIGIYKNQDWLVAAASYEPGFGNTNFRHAMMGGGCNAEGYSLIVMQSIKRSGLQNLPHTTDVHTVEMSVPDTGSLHTPVFVKSRSEVVEGLPDYY